MSPVIWDSKDLTQLERGWRVSDQIVFHATYESPDRHPDFEVLEAFPDQTFAAHAGGESHFDSRQIESATRYFNVEQVYREYEITPGEPLTLDASGSLAPKSARYEWDLDGDGQFDDAEGIIVDVSWEQIREISAGHPFDANLRVTTDTGQAFDQVQVSSPNRLAGDANLDGVVDFADFLIMAANFNQQPAAWAEGDFDNTGDVDFSDFLLLSENFARRIPGANG